MNSPLFKTRMSMQSLYAILRDATEGELLTGKNDAFMKLFRDNMRYSLQLEMYIEMFGIIVPMQSANRSQLKRAAKEESIFGRKEEVGQVAAQEWRMKEEEDENIVTSKWTCTSPTHPHQKSKWRKSKASQLKENDEEEEESSVDELDDDTDTILRSVEDDTDCQRNTLKTPPVTSLAGYEDVHATLEATVASLIEDDDTQIAPETKK
ncbi:hypothetical protein EI94DRAFT_1698601 [Lactarius quietus]|nr:hypothetical protein EI94DRAFT_1698601 [Lactarius quietus]